LVNLVGIKSPEWARPVEEAPQALGPLSVRIYIEQAPARAWTATPDEADPAARPLTGRMGTDESGDYLLLEIPSLKYWSLIVLEWE